MENQDRVKAVKRLGIKKRIKRKIPLRMKKPVKMTKAQLFKENPFALFSDDKNYKQATLDIYNLINQFIKDLEKLECKYTKCGATDTASRDCIATFIAVNKLRMFRLVAGQPPIPSEKFEQMTAKC
jgi:hypothetical protein